jgi:hypothetical protein
MISIDSSLWRLRAYEDSSIHITQRASGAIRTRNRGIFPSAHEMAMMSESRFNKLCREAFRDECRPRKGIY